MGLHTPGFLQYTSHKQPLQTYVHWHVLHTIIYEVPAFRPNILLFKSLRSFLRLVFFFTFTAYLAIRHAAFRTYMKIEVSPLHDNKTGSFTCCRNYRISKNVCGLSCYRPAYCGTENCHGTPLAAIPTQWTYRTPACIRVETFWLINTNTKRVHELRRHTALMLHSVHNYGASIREI